MENYSIIRFVGSNCTDPSRQKEFDDWYANRHIPLCLRSPLMTGAERYERVMTVPGAEVDRGQRYPNHLAVYHFENEAGLSEYLKHPNVDEQKKDVADHWPGFPTSGVFQSIWVVAYKRVGKWEK